MNRLDQKRSSWLLSYYRSSEIAGALFFGRLSRQVKDPDLILFLTEQFHDESGHAYLWTKLIFDLGLKPIQIRSTYQSNYSQYIDIPTTLAEVLMITKIFEVRVAERFNQHLQQPNLDPRIKNTIKEMLLEEEGHVKWLEDRLKIQCKIDGKDLNMLKEKYLEADKKSYNKIIKYENKIWEITT